VLLLLVATVARCVERERLRRNRDLCRPPLRVAARHRVPNALPIPILPIDIGIDGFASHAVGVDVELVARAPLVVGIKSDRKAVLAERDVVPAQDLGDNAIGLAVPESGSEIKIVVIVGEVDARALARLTELVRDHHVKVVEERRFLPDRVVELAIEHGRDVGPERLNGLASRFLGRSGRAQQTENGREVRYVPQLQTPNEHTRRAGRAPGTIPILDEGARR
jgi:hypothetical protein